jgi:hypothetical protein
MACEARLDGFRYGRGAWLMVSDAEQGKERHGQGAYSHYR